MPERRNLALAAAVASLAVALLAIVPKFTPVAVANCDAAAFSAKIAVRGVDR